MQAQEIHPGLWQGSWPPPGRWLADKGISTLVLCAYEYQPPFRFPDQVAMLVGLRSPSPWPDVNVCYAPLDDSFSQQPPRDALHAALKAARYAAAMLAQRRRVLVTCWQGRNRSGLVSALTLHLHLGISGKDAVRIVQTRRQRGLRNPIFVDMLSRLRQPRGGESLITVR